MKSASSIKDLSNILLANSTLVNPIHAARIKKRTFRYWQCIGINQRTATNTYSTGQTNAMLTGGVDLNITQNVTLGFNVNYVFLPDGVTFDALQAMTLLYLKF